MTLVAGSVLAALLAAPLAAQEPTWREVAPIVQRRCAGCHHATGPAPFPLVTLQDVASRGSFVGQLVERALMPPWMPDDRGLALADENRVTAAEQRLLLRWLGGERAAHPSGDDGLPDGAIPSPPSPDRVLAMSRAWTIPAEGPPDMRSFVLPLDNEAPVRLAGIGYVPRSPRAVHTVTFVADPHGIGRRLEKAGPGAGYDAMGDVGATVSGTMGAVGPGVPVMLLPAGFAWELPARSDLVAEVHFVPRGRPEPIQDEVQLYLADESATRVVHGLWLTNLEVHVPPGDADHELVDSIVLPFDVDVLGLLPRASPLCVSLELTATLPDAERLVLLSIPRWDPHFRRPYLLDEILRLPAGTRLDALWRLDNSTDNPGNPVNPPRLVRLGSEITDAYPFFLLWVAPLEPVDGEDVTRFLVEQARARFATRDAR